MLTLISFFFNPNFLYKNKDSYDSVVSGIQQNIDILLKHKWESQDIIIKTNFDFSYKNINAIKFKYTECSNLFITKIIAAYEVLEENPHSLLWLHDHDTYQIREFDMLKLDEELTHDINMCNYWPGNPRPQGASVFYKGFSQTIVDLYNQIKKTDTSLFHDDEDFFMYFAKNFGGSFNFDLSYNYNTSLTKFTHNKRFTDTPFCLHGDIKKRFERRVFLKYCTDNRVLE